MHHLYTRKFYKVEESRTRSYITMTRHDKLNSKQIYSAETKLRKQKPLLFRQEGKHQSLTALIK